MFFYLIWFSQSSELFILFVFSSTEVVRKRHGELFFTIFCLYLFIWLFFHNILFISYLNLISYTLGPYTLALIRLKLTVDCVKHLKKNSTEFWFLTWCEFVCQLVQLHGLQSHLRFLSIPKKKSGDDHKPGFVYRELNNHFKFCEAVVISHFPSEFPLFLFQ